LEKLKRFDQDEWELKTAEVRTDKGLFVNSGWPVEIDGREWWIVIGYEDKIVTVIETDKEGLGPDIVTEGELYNEVKRVNES